MRLLFLALLFTSSGVLAQDLSGTWSGPLDLQGQTITFVFHVTPEASGGYAVAADIPEQNAAGIPAAVAVSGDSVAFTIPAAQFEFEGVRDGTTITGTILGPQPFALTLTRTGDAAPAARRPQTPQGPFPYATEDLRFESVEGVTLAGTVTIPEGMGPFPGVVLVSGSGAQDRDGNVLGHKIFAVWADHLARVGIASIRYDERGVSESTGSFGGATTFDFADDARVAAQFLAARDDVDRVGIVGHSEGGVVAPLVAGDLEATAFVVLMAGSAVPGRDILPDQSEALMVASGADPAAAEAYARGYRAAFDVFLASPEVTDETTAGMTRAFVDAGADMPVAVAAQFGLTETTAPMLVNTLAAQLDDPWMRTFASHDPAPALRALRIPALAVFATLDLQVTPRLNLAPMREALAASASPNHSVVVFDGLNHLLQPATTGSDSEYGQIETTVSTEVLDLVATWILGASD